MKILITGKNGQVGWELQRVLTLLGNVVATSRSELDLTNAASIRECVRKIGPNIIVNAGAYTSVDKAESEPELAMAVNGIAPGILAEEAERLNALLIHYSSDYVFDGTKSDFYSEGDIPNPLNIYGATKLAGERAIQAVGAAHIILRTSWIYGSRGQNFMLTMLRLAKEREELRVVNDQIGAPTWCRWTAEATREIIKVRVRGNFENPTPASDGIVHLTASGSTSWCGFASEIVAESRKSRERQPTVVPVSSVQYPTAAKRPRNSLLSNEKLRRVFGVKPEPWQAGLHGALSEWLDQKPTS